MHESSVAWEIATGLCLFLDWESPWFYQQCNMSDAENPKCDNSHVCFKFKVESKVAVIISDPVTSFPVSSMLSVLIMWPNS